MFLDTKIKNHYLSSLGVVDAAITVRRNAEENLNKEKK